jgi:stage III sporulation protein AC
MDVSLIMRIAGVGILVSVVVAILNKSGRDEQAMLVTVAGILVVMLMLVEEIGALLESVQSVFGF